MKKYLPLLAAALALTGDGHIALPNGCAGKMARALAERVCVCPLIHLDRQAEGGDFQRTEIAAAVIEVFSFNQSGEPVKMFFIDNL